MTDVHHRNLNLLKRAVVIERQPSELVCAQNINDFDDGVYFLARIAIGFKANVRFQSLNLKGQGGLARSFFFLGRLLAESDFRFSLFVPQGFDRIELCRLHGRQPAADNADND